jgi:hypothetical protein
MADGAINTRGTIGRIPNARSLDIHDLHDSCRPAGRGTNVLPAARLRMTSTMRLTSILCLLLLVAPCAFADSASSSQPPDVAVSPITYMPAAGSQTNPRAASNGDVMLVAWSDARNGNQAYAARIAGDGSVLDPLGIPLGIPWGPDEVVWNGDSFSVLGRDYDNGFVLLLIALDGTIERQPLGMGYARYAAATGDGADVRFLFLMAVPYGGGSTVVDGKGNIVGGATPLWTPWPSVPNPLVFSPLVAAGPTKSGFVVLLQTYDYSSRKIYSALFDRDGHILSTVDAQLPFNVIEGNESIEQGADGFLLANQRWIDPAVLAFRLDANGVYTGKMVAAGSSDNVVKLSNYQPRIVWDGSRYLLLWRSYVATAHAYVYLAAVDAEASSVEKHLVLDAAATSGAILVRRVAQPLVITTAVPWGSTSASLDDVYVQRFTPALEAGAPQLVVSTATRQNGAQVATTRNGYAVAWSEVGPDQYAHAFVRRFTPAGQPYDSQPIEIAHGVPTYYVTAPYFLRVVSNGTTYAVVWRASSKLQLRRLADQRGQWLDPQPVSIPDLGDVAFASDGKDILAVGSGPCTSPPGGSGCIVAQRIVIGADMVPTPPVISASSSPAPGQYALASNGTDYLAVWTDGLFGCNTLCPAPPLRILAVRLRADGTALDSAPLAIEDANQSSSEPSVAWSGGRYAVAWLAYGINRGEVRMATVTPEGAVRDTDPIAGGTVVQRGGTSEGPSAVRVVAFDGAFALVTQTVGWSVNSIVRPTRWDEVAFCATCDLRDLLTASRTTLLQAPDQPTDFGSFDIAAHGSSIVLAYDRTGEAESGFVPRIYSRTFAAPPRRRAATH